MNARIFTAGIAAGLLAMSSVAATHAAQTTAAPAQVLSARPIYSESMVDLQRAAQHLRETIQSLAQRAPGAERDQAMRDARRALEDTRIAMVRLPAEYRVDGVVVSNVPIARAQPAQNRTFDGSMNELQLAADRLRQSIQAMADQPAGARRNQAIKEANDALIATQEAMLWVPGYPQSPRTAANADDARGRASSRAGGGTLVAGSDASTVGGSAAAVAGGVGLNARAMLSSDASDDHNVKMVFALDSGNYVADVHVNVRDGAGRTVVDGMSDGPWLYAKLPPGSYTATATYAGRADTERFTVGKRGRKVAHFRWPASVEKQVAARADTPSPILGSGPQAMSSGF